MTFLRILLISFALICLTLPAAGQTITACVDAETGELYNVAIGPSPSDSCERGDRELSWNQPGRRGQNGPERREGPPCAGETLYEFEGFAPVFLDGDDGGLTMTNSCDEHFPGSRMCTTEEVIQSGAISTDSTISAWVRPTIVAVTDGTAVDITGLEAADASNLSCFNWSSTSESVTGTNVWVDEDSKTARIRLQTCTATANVACCSPCSD